MIEIRQILMLCDKFFKWVFTSGFFFIHFLLIQSSRNINVLVKMALDKKLNMHQLRSAACSI